MKTTILKKLLLACVLISALSLGSCKDDHKADGDVAGEPTQVDNYPENATTETRQASDTTSRAEEDSIMDVPSP